MRRRTLSYGAEVLEARLLLFETSVTSAADILDASDGVVALREAIQAVNTGTATELWHTDNAIFFAEDLAGQTIHLSGDPLVITADMLIIGPANHFFVPARAWRAWHRCPSWSICISTEHSISPTMLGAAWPIVRFFTRSTSPARPSATAGWSTLAGAGLCSCSA